MASVKISELNNIVSIASEDFLPLVDSSSGTTYRATFNDLNTWMAAYGSCSHADIADFAWLAHTASYTRSSSYSLYAVSASHADTASYFDTSTLTVPNATNAVNAQTASCLNSFGHNVGASITVSHSVVSGTLKIGDGGSIQIPLKTNVFSETMRENSIFFNRDYATTSTVCNDWGRIYFTTTSVAPSGPSPQENHARLVFEYGDNLDALLPVGPDINYHAAMSPGFLWETLQPAEVGAETTGSLMFLKTDGMLYLRSATSRTFYSTLQGGDGFQGTASWASNLVGGVGAAVEPPIGTIVDYAGASDPADSNWLLCDGSEKAIASYPTLATVLGATWGAAAVGNFKLPDFTGRMTIGNGAAYSRISQSVGNSGGGDNINYHHHAIARTSYGWENNGTCRNDDFGMWWSNYTILNTTTQFPIVTSPFGDTTRLYIVTGDATGNDRVQPNGAAAVGDDGGWCAVSSYGLGPTSDMMPPYGVVQKIIRAL